MAKRLYTYIFIGVAFVLSIAGCTDRRQGTVQPHQPKDTLHAERRAMAVYEYDPVRALAIVDSATCAGHLSHWGADFYRARIYSCTQVPERIDLNHKKTIKKWNEQ